MLCSFFEHFSVPGEWGVFFLSIASSREDGFLCVVLLVGLHGVYVFVILYSLGYEKLCSFYEDLFFLFFFSGVNKGG